MRVLLDEIWQLNTLMRATIDEVYARKNPRWHEQPRAPIGSPEGGQWIEGAMPAGWGLLIKPVLGLVRTLRNVQKLLKPALTLMPLDVSAPMPPRLAAGEYIGMPSARRPQIPYLEFDYYAQFLFIVLSAGRGYNWHHIVEQNTVDKGLFPARAVQNTDNIVRVTKIEHVCINRAYASILPTGITLRESLRGQPWSRHYSVGLDVLKRCRNVRKRKP